MPSPKADLGPVYERIVAVARPLGVINLLRRAFERG